MLAIRDLRYAWPGASADTLAIDALELPVGRSLFLHGPSGCGKSTLLGLLAGVLVARAGVVSLLGQDWRRLSAAGRDARRADHVGVIFQQFNLLPYLSAIDNVLLPCRFSALRATRCPGAPRAAAEELLERVGLEPALWARRASELSVGQQQRVAAARALIGAPELVIADEPTSALDAALREDFMALLLGECRARGGTLVFVSHDERLAQHLEPARHVGLGGAVDRARHRAVADAGAPAHRHPDQLRAVGERHRPRDRRPHRPGPADAVRGVSGRRGDQPDSHGQRGPSPSTAPSPGPCRSRSATRIAAFRCWARRRSTSSASATATASRSRWPRAAPLPARPPPCTRPCWAPRWPPCWATISASASRSAMAWSPHWRRSPPSTATSLSSSSACSRAPAPRSIARCTSACRRSRRSTSIGPAVRRRLDRSCRPRPCASSTSSPSG